MNSKTNQTDNDDSSKKQRKRKSTLVPSSKYKRKTKQNTRPKLTDSASDNTSAVLPPKMLKSEKTRSVSDPERRTPSILTDEADLKTVNKYIDKVLISHEGDRAKINKKKSAYKNSYYP